MGRRARQVAETRFGYERIAQAYRTAMRSSHQSGTAQADEHRQAIEVRRLTA
jgi:hypothetical protein